jgi:predicted glycosyltransferase
MTRPIGYYVHHHGDGHRQRAIAIGHCATTPMTLLGTGLLNRNGGLPCVDLPDDRIDPALCGYNSGERPASLHYVPVDHEGIRQRVASLTTWIAQARPSLMVIDVSAEVAMLSRLASVPTVYVRLSGNRLDQPHLEAFDSAIAILAPFHETLDDENTPNWLRAKSFYAPNLAPGGHLEVAVEADVILVVIGRGGGTSDGEKWAAAARATSDFRWRIVGPCTVPQDPPANLQLCGWVNDAASMIASAGIVVGAAGDGLVSSVIARRRPFICFPEPRPFDEQLSKAKRLASVGGAVVPTAWPSDGDWADLIAQSVALASKWPSELSEPGGGFRVARWLETLASVETNDRSSIA